MTMYQRRFGVIAGLLLACAYGASARTATATSVKPLPFVSQIFGDNMVLQRGKANTIWGWSDPGDNVRVEVADRSASAVAGQDRHWEVKIQPPGAGGPYVIKISGTHQTLELHDVLVGDVWLCGGQSNMGVPLGFARNGEDEVKVANFPEIRFFSVAPKVRYAWQSNPAATLFNGAGLPAAPFRTDNWPGITEAHRPH